jgi:putative IMPACT (imprinted ancient) family translation regulator
MLCAGSYSKLFPHLWVLPVFILLAGALHAQQPDTMHIDSSILKNIAPPVLGPNDTITVAAKITDGTLVPAGSLENVWVVKPAPPGMKARIEQWTRLRNAVYVTYPYARRAGYILNDINAKIEKMPGKEEKKAYIKTREKELRKEFTDPLTNLSIYQGKVLMKLINRQTGNNCYEIIKDYKGGVTARVYQTVAFFFSTSLKQPYDSQGDDREIESIVKEVERMYGGRM